MHARTIMVIMKMTQMKMTAISPPSIVLLEGEGLGEVVGVRVVLGFSGIPSLSASVEEDGVEGGLTGGLTAGTPGAGVGAKKEWVLL